MAREQIEITQYYEQVVEALRTHGLLLASYDGAGKANAMTIGWGSLGVIWGLPIWIVLVRPSRYTYQCVEHSGCFTVNVPTEAMGMICATCGSRSGRDTDKFADCKITEVRSQRVLAPIIEECPISYECQVIHSNDVLPKKLADELLSGPYVNGDFHRVYYGKILRAAAEPNAAELIRA